MTAQPAQPSQSRKRAVQSFLQRVLGFDRYLYWFALFKVPTLHRDTYEADFFHFADMMPRDAVVLDVGANLGVMTVHLARRSEAGSVHSFEPMPENFRALGRVVAHYGLDNVTIHQMALGDVEGDLEMVMPELDSVRMQGLSRVVPPGAEAPAGRRLKVPVHRLDDLAFLDDVTVAGMKVDVEDFERHVFEGGRELIGRCMPIVYTELNDGPNRVACFEFFEELGYTVAVAHGAGVVPYDPDRHDKHNFFMLPPSPPPAAEVHGS